MTTHPATICHKCGHAALDHSDFAGCLAENADARPESEGPFYYCPCQMTPASIQATSPFDPAEGGRRRDEGTARAGTGAPASLVAYWQAKADQAMGELIGMGVPFTADDLVERAGMPPVPNMVGGLFHGAHRGKRIQAVGYATGKRPESHARVQRTWLGA